MSISKIDRGTNIRENRIHLYCCFSFGATATSQNFWFCFLSFTFDH